MVGCLVCSVVNDITSDFKAVKFVYFNKNMKFLKETTEKLHILN